MKLFFNNFNEFSKEIEKLASENFVQQAIYLMIIRYSLEKVEYYFNKIDIYKVQADNLFLYKSLYTPKDFELKDVIEKCEHN